jgi:hypothetical protein
MRHAEPPLSSPPLSEGAVSSGTLDEKRRAPAIPQEGRGSFKIGLPDSFLYSRLIGAPNDQGLRDKSTQLG